jgi:hypothetical protein
MIQVTRTKGLKDFVGSQPSSGNQVHGLLVILTHATQIIERIGMDYPPSGCLLCGAPKCGKDLLLARAKAMGWA